MRFSTQKNTRRGENFHPADVEKAIHPTQVNSTQVQWALTASNAKLPEIAFM